MSLLRRTRAEVAGAVRSLRYDLGKHPAEPPSGGPDMTSTGMSTFGGLPIDEPSSAYGRRRRPPRKAVAVSALGLLTVTGAAGAYLAVVNGLGSLVSESPAAADALPAKAQPVATADAQLGAGPVPQRTASTSVTTSTAPDGRRVVIDVAPPVPAGPQVAAAATKPARNASPIRTTIPTSPECRCDPPVPTPTAPTSSPSPTPSADPPDSESPSESPSATPDDSAEPSDSPQARRHRHRS